MLARGIRRSPELPRGRARGHPRGCEAHLFVLEASFRELVAEAIRKHSRRELIRLAGALAEAIRFEAFTVWEKPGIRAQLLDTAPSRLAMSFVTEHDDHSLHVLNVVSQAFTCLLPFAEHVCDIIGSTKCVAYTAPPTVR